MKAPDSEKEKYVSYLLVKDEEFTKRTDISLFDFFICQKKNVQIDSSLIEKYQKEENEREEKASKNSGIYYEYSLIQELAFDYYKKCEELLYYYNGEYKLINLKKIRQKIVDLINSKILPFGSHRRKFLKSILKPKKKGD